MNNHHPYEVSKISFAEQLKVGGVVASFGDIFASDLKSNENFIDEKF